MGRFLHDSISIGTTVQYSLAVRYPKETELVFPDSTWNYLPLEYVSRQSFATRSDSSSNYDSAVYTLTTFEIDAVQELALPVFVLSGGDSTIIRAAADQVMLAQLITTMPDSVALKSDTRYAPVSYSTNWLLILLVLTPAVLLLGGQALVLAGPIRRQFLRKRLQKRHAQFIMRLQKEAEALGEQPGPEETEAALLTWKQYLEQLEGIPYTRLTTKELGRALDNAELQQTLKSIDRTVYSGRSEGSLLQQFELLRNYAASRFEVIIQEAPYV